jgi:hypothetical protein
MSVLKRISIAALGFVLISGSLSAQTKKKTDFSGTWKYEVRDTPSGDFFGNIILKKVNEKYTGEIINDKGLKDSIHVTEHEGNKLVFTSQVEEADETFHCVFTGDSLHASIDVVGDNFNYQLRAKRVPAKK